MVILEEKVKGFVESELIVDFVVPPPKIASV
jgi:hypothetical protein